MSEGGSGRTTSGKMTIGLISDVFFSADGERRLHQRLAEARAAGAELAVLPELPLDPWIPARRQPRDRDAELPGGRRAHVLASAARSVGIGVVGGAIVCDRVASGRRRSTALIFDDVGRLVASYCKCHLPHEPGYWEMSHYEPGEQPARPVGFAVPFGVQICSDANRPAGFEALAARGAELIVVPRATEASTFGRWRHVFQANAITGAVFVASVNRPRPEFGIDIGGPSIVVAPEGEVLLETTDPVAIMTIERAAIRDARSRYPGSLPIRAELYARAWREAGRERSSTP